MSKSLAVIVFAITMTISAYAEIDFDKGNGVNIEGAVAKLKVKIPQAKSQNKEILGSQKDRLLVMKDWLKDLSDEDRAEFLGGLLLVDGKVVSIYTAPLKRTLSKKQMEKIISAFIRPSATKRNKTLKNGKYSPMVKLSELFKDVPTNVKREFFDRMVFKNGRIVSFYTGGLKKAVSESKLKEIRLLLSPGKENVPEDLRVLCGNGICYESICSGESGHRYCMRFNDYDCTTDCYDLK